MNINLNQIRMLQVIYVTPTELKRGGGVKHYNYTYISTTWILSTEIEKYECIMFQIHFISEIFNRPSLSALADNEASRIIGKIKL